VKEDTELTRDDLRRFWNKIRTNSGNGCWIWTGNMTSDKGNGTRMPQFWLGEDKVSARRLSYLIHFGELPKKVEVSCGDPLCVCPRHLLPAGEPGDGIGKVYRPQRKHKPYDEKVVRQIITLRKLGYTQPKISKKTGVGQGQICLILKMAKLCKQNKLKPFRKKTAVAV
jgi:hypothetical protein